MTALSTALAEQAERLNDLAHQAAAHSLPLGQQLILQACQLHLASIRIQALERTPPP